MCNFTKIRPNKCWVTAMRVLMCHCSLILMMTVFQPRELSNKSWKHNQSKKSQELQLMFSGHLCLFQNLFLNDVKWVCYWSVLWALGCTSWHVRGSVTWAYQLSRQACSGASAETGESDATGPSGNQQPVSWFTVFHFFCPHPFKNVKMQLKQAII